MRTKRFFIAAIAAFMLALNIAAAESPKLTKEQIAEIEDARIKAFQQELGLSEEQVNQFAPIYRRYSAEVVEAMQASRERKIKKPASNSEALSEVNRRIDVRIKYLNLQKKYMEEFSKILSPEQTMKVLAVEERLNNKMKNHKKKGAKNNARQR